MLPRQCDRLQPVYAGVARTASTCASLTSGIPCEMVDVPVFLSGGEISRQQKSGDCLYLPACHHVPVRLPERSCGAWPVCTRVDRNRRRRTGACTGYSLEESGSARSEERR